MYMCACVCARVKTETCKHEYNIIDAPMHSIDAYGTACIQSNGI